MHMSRSSQVGDESYRSSYKVRRNSHPLHAKSVDEVLDAVKNYFFSYGYPKQTIQVNFAMPSSNYFARKIKSSCPMERQELQPYKVLWKEATKHGKKI